MNWYRHPQTIEALAASYVMGSMSARARRRFPAVELAVSIERGVQPPAAPTAPFVYRGLCGKVWQ